MKKDLIHSKNRRILRTQEFLKIDSNKENKYSSNEWHRSNVNYVEFLKEELEVQQLKHRSQSSIRNNFQINNDLVDPHYLKLQNKQTMEDPKGSKSTNQNKFKVSLSFLFNLYSIIQYLETLS